MAEILFIVFVALTGNTWSNLWGHEEVKFTAEAQCDGGSIFDPDGCPRLDGTQDGGSIFDPDGGGILDPNGAQ